jgi:hypothetical protein
MPLHTVFSGAVTFSDSLTANGNTILGDTDSDTLTVNASSTFATSTDFRGSITLGGGDAISKHISQTLSLNLSEVATATCISWSTTTITGVAAGDTVKATPQPVASGIETLNLIWNSYASTTDEVAMRVCNVDAVTNADPALQTWRFDIWKH